MNETIETWHLDQTSDVLKGVDEVYVQYHNHWAAVALDRYNHKEKAYFEFTIDKRKVPLTLIWDSNFPTDTYREDTEIAERGAVALALFVMSVLLNYTYFQQSEIGEGVDYRFMKEPPDDLNFFNDSHFIEVSGLLEESKSNTLKSRIRKKHKQIDNGCRKDDPSSIFIALFSEPIIIKEVHK